MTTERQTGWYWVKPDDDKWEAAYWDGGAWLVADVDGSWPDSEIEVVGPRIPAPGQGWQCVPMEITAESGHKAGMIGDFHAPISMMCTECDIDDPDPDCEVCDGLVEFEGRAPISWTTIKAIHRRIVEISAAPKPGGE